MLINSLSGAVHVTQHLINPKQLQGTINFPRITTQTLQVES